MRYVATPFLLTVILGMFGFQPALATDSADNRNLRFVAELSVDSSREKASRLDVTFYSQEPPSDRAKEVILGWLGAMKPLYSKSDITVQAWFSTSPGQSEKQPIPLEKGSNSLVFVAGEQVPRAGDGAEADPHSQKTRKEDNGLAPILEDRRVLKKCQDVPQDRLLALASVGAKNRGLERRFMVKAMREWCTDNNVALDRQLRICIGAVSKSILARNPSAAQDPQELAAAIARGAEAYKAGQCAKCHQGNGRGGPRGPDLLSGKWLHCDGSVEGILKVLKTGVPQSKLKDSSRPFGMNPATQLIPDQKQLADLAVYVHSLSGD